MDGENNGRHQGVTLPNIQALSNGDSPSSLRPHPYPATSTHLVQGRLPPPTHDNGAGQGTYAHAHPQGHVHRWSSPAPIAGAGFVHTPHEQPSRSYHAQHPGRAPQLLQHQHSYHPQYTSAYAQTPAEPRHPRYRPPSAHQSRIRYSTATAYDAGTGGDQYANAGYHPTHPQHQMVYSPEHAAAAHGAYPVGVDGAACTEQMPYRRPVHPHSHPSQSPRSLGYYPASAGPTTAPNPHAPHESAQRLPASLPERWQGSPPAMHPGYAGANSQDAFGPRYNMDPADYYRASTSTAMHIVSSPAQPQPIPQQPQPQQPPAAHRPNGAHSGPNSHSAVVQTPLAGSHREYPPASSTSHPSSTLPPGGTPVAAASMDINNPQSEGPQDKDAKLQRRKSNAECAARLRKRRKQKETDLLEACAKLEARIAELKRELAYEKQRARERLWDANTPDPSGRAPSGEGDEEMASEPMGRFVAVGAKRQRSLDDASDGESPRAGAAAPNNAPALLESRPLRELDMVRLSELRSSIGALAEVSQKIWICVGRLRQVIQLHSQKITAQKAAAPAAAH